MGTANARVELRPTIPPPPPPVERVVILTITMSQAEADLMADIASYNVTIPGLVAPGNAYNQAKAVAMLDAIAEALRRAR